MQAFSNVNIIDKLCGGCDCTGFLANVTYAYDASAKTVTATDATTYTVGDYRKIVHFFVYDSKGNKAISSIASADGDGAVVLSVAALDASEGLNLWATVVSNQGCISDGHASNIVATGSLGSWDKDNDAITVGAQVSES